MTATVSLDAVHERGAAADLFCAARAAEGASPRTVEWYRMITVRCVRHFGESRPLDAISAADLRAWLLELRTTSSPESVAGYVRGLKAFGNWCAAEEIAQAAGFRALRRRISKTSGTTLGWFKTQWGWGATLPRKAVDRKVAMLLGTKTTTSGTPIWGLSWDFSAANWN